LIFGGEANDDLRSKLALHLMLAGGTGLLGSANLAVRAYFGTPRR
jgi:hypothetical protein